jgi:prefoldin subunit 5
MDEHDILDLAAKAQIISRGIEYGVLVKDIDTLRKAVIDLQECATIMDEIVEDDFGE